MYEPKEEMLKDVAAQECGRSATAYLGCDTAIARPSLMERVRGQQSRARQEARQAERLAELEYLLEKNPEVARILDLMESLKG